MAKIAKINFYNYKAFYSKTENAYTLDLDGGKNLLIYGENGSGKSSIFDGLRDFFLSAVSEIEFNQNILSKGAIPKEPYIEVEFTVPNQPFYFSMEDNKSNASSQPFIRDTNKVKSFLSYKNLLALHYFRPKDEVNIFDILFSRNGILFDYINPVGKSANSTNISLGLLYDKIVNYSNERRNSLNYNQILRNPSIISDFNEGVKKTLQLILKNTNKFLHLFNQKFYVRKFIYTPLVLNNVEYKPDRLSGGKLSLNLYFFKTEILDYNVFLNEARLTALSLSIYFSAIQTIPAPQFQIIFLDDIFIGLDTSNRVPLLNILKQFFIKDYQIIITTYDRHWYTIAKEQLGNNNWYTAEIYLDQKEKHFQPVIIQPTLDYYDLAKKYFDAKDYPACGNYQRKEFEKLISDFLPSNLTLAPNEDGTVNRITKLETLFDHFKNYVDKCGLDFFPFKDFGLYKRVVLNPLSHDDIQSPYFKTELEKTFEILESLQKIKKTEIIKAGESLFITKNDSQGIANKFSLTAKENFYVFKQGNLKIYSKIDFQTINKWSNGTRVDFPSDITRLELVYKNICTFLSVIPQTDFYNEFYTDQNNYLSNF